MYTNERLGGAVLLLSFGTISLEYFGGFKASLFNVICVICGDYERSKKLFSLYENTIGDIVGLIKTNSASSQEFSSIHVNFE